MTVAIRTLWDKVLKLKKQGRALMLTRDEDYEEDAAIEDVVEEEPVEFADPEDDEFELEKFWWQMCMCISQSNYTYTWPISPKHDPKL